MENEKDLEFEATGSKKDDNSENSSRARNRTVMLTPEMTSQVRSRLAQDLDQGQPGPVSTRQRPEPENSGGFYTPTPGATQRHVAEHSGAGAHLSAVPPPAPKPAQPIQQTEGILWVKESPVIGFLVGYDSNPNGTVYELRSGRLMITSQATAGENSLVMTDGSVSPMHAILRISGSGEIQVLDQLSELGTKIRRFGSEEEETLSGEKSTLEHGDIVTFGNRPFHVCIIPRGNQE